MKRVTVACISLILVCSQILWPFSAYAEVASGHAPQAGQPLVIGEGGASAEAVGDLVGAVGGGETSAPQQSVTPSGADATGGSQTGEGEGSGPESGVPVEGTLTGDSSAAPSETDGVRPESGQSGDVDVPAGADRDATSGAPGGVDDSPDGANGDDLSGQGGTEEDPQDDSPADSSEVYAPARVENSFRYVDGSPVAFDDAPSLGSSVVVPENASAWGVDVDERSGVIDWAKMKECGASFALLRIGVGAHDLDEQFAANVQGCIDSDIPFGIVLYSLAWDAQTASVEADWVLQSLATLGIDLSTVQLPVFFDMENQVHAEGHPSHGKPAGLDGANAYRVIETPEAFAAMAQAFSAKLKEAGCTAGVYAPAAWWDTYLTAPIFDELPQWVACYDAGFLPDDAFEIWQSAPCCSIDGAGAPIGLNFLTGELPGVALDEHVDDQDPEDAEGDGSESDSDDSLKEEKGDELESDESKDSVAPLKTPAAPKTEAPEKKSSSKKDEKAAPKGPMLIAEPHVRNLGWTGKVQNDAVIGTTGRALSLEALKLSLGSGAGKGGIETRAHVSNIGWQGWTSKTAGTTGRALAIEALQIRLTGDASKKYDIWYRVHAANLGWLGWTSNGEKAGTEGLAYAAEAVQIKILPKGSKAPGSTSGAYRAHTLIAKAHVRNRGWLGNAYDSAVIGTTGRALSLEALKLSLGPGAGSGGIQVRSHVSNIGWQGWTSGTSGTTGRALAIEALQIRLTGAAAANYDVWYRVHSSNVGWLGWTSNGEKAGTEGMALSAEALQVKVLPKGSKAPGSTAGAYMNVPTVSYQSFGAGAWMPAQPAMGTAGTTGKNKPIYAFKLSISSAISGSASYRVHVANKGWQNAVGAGGVAGAEDSKNAIQAIRISLNGELAKHFNIWYRVYVQGIGWLGWAKNGASAGTEKANLNVEAIQVAIRGNSSPAPGSTSNSFSSGTGGLPYIGYQTPGNYHKVSNKSVHIKNQGSGIHGYRTESRIPFNATRNDCVNAMITRAMEYVGTPYIWDYACAPGVGVDCAGLVLQALYATGMDLSPMNPWDHFYTPGHDAYANFMRTSARFKHVPFSQRQVGDLILTNGHVSIYMGNDNIIEAYPQAGVRWANVYSTMPILAVARPFP